MARQTLNSLQVLRGFASLAVVANHSFRAVTIYKPLGLLLPAPLLLRNDWLVEIGAFGVDIFFVLSGFLMIFISKPYVEKRKPISDFVANRLIRIWPLYALVTLLVCVLGVARAFKTHTVDFDLEPLRLLSFFFVPSFNEKNLLQPILGPGWTLNYEILFYICFAVALFVTRKWAVLGLTAILFLLFIIGFVLPPSSIGGKFLFNSILFEFVFGSFVAIAFLNDSIPSFRAEYWLIAGAISLGVLSQWPIDDGYRALTRGVPAVLIFIGMLRLEGRVAWSGFLLLLGNASYSIYLMHSIAVGLVAPKVLVLLAHHGLSIVAAELAAAVALVAGVTAGVICYQFVEKPVLKLCRELYTGFIKPQPPAGEPIGLVEVETTAPQAKSL